MVFGLIIIFNNKKTNTFGGNFLSDFYYWFWLTAMAVVYEKTACLEFFKELKN